MKKSFAFEKSMKRSLYGEKVTLKCVSDEVDTYWIIPKKFSVEGVDAYAQLQIKQQRALKQSSDGMKKVTEILKGKDVSNPDKIMAALTQEEIGILVTAMPDDVASREALYRLFLSYGVGKHNLTGEDSEIMTEDLINAILQSSELTMEMFLAINEWNDFFSKPRNAKS
jgi:hypothetical protein